MCLKAWRGTAPGSARKQLALPPDVQGVTPATPGTCLWLPGQDAVQPQGTVPRVHHRAQSLSPGQGRGRDSDPPAGTRSRATTPLLEGRKEKDGRCPPWPLGPGAAPTLRPRMEPQVMGRCLARAA